MWLLDREPTDFACLPAVTDRCAFDHIPTGTTTNYRIAVDEEEHRSDAMTVATSAIGAGTDFGQATP